MHDIIQKTRVAYNKIAQHFSDTRYDLWPELKRFAPFIQDGQNILDWGSGNGRLILLLKNRKVKYFGVDQSVELIKIAEKKYQQEIQSGWVSFFCVEKQEKKFPADFFDLVFMIASFHHLPDQTSRLKLLQKIYQEMKPGAKLVMTNWNLGSDWAKGRIAAKKWKTIGDHDFIIPWKNSIGEIETERYYHWFTPEELSSLLIKAGFQVELMEYDQGGKSSNAQQGRSLLTLAVKT